MRLNPKAPHKCKKFPRPMGGPLLEKRAWDAD